MSAPAIQAEYEPERMPVPVFFGPEKGPDGTENGRQNGFYGKIADFSDLFTIFASCQKNQKSTIPS